MDIDTIYFEIHKLRFFLLFYIKVIEMISFFLIYPLLYQRSDQKFIIFISFSHPLSRQFFLWGEMGFASEKRREVATIQTCFKLLSIAEYFPKDGKQPDYNCSGKRFQISSSYYCSSCLQMKQTHFFPLQLQKLRISFISSKILSIP